MSPRTRAFLASSSLAPLLSFDPAVAGLSTPPALVALGSTGCLLLAALLGRWASAARWLLVFGGLALFWSFRQALLASPALALLAAVAATGLAVTVLTAPSGPAVPDAVSRGASQGTLLLWLTHLLLHETTGRWSVWLLCASLLLTLVLSASLLGRRGSFRVRAAQVVWLGAAAAAGVAALGYLPSDVIGLVALLLSVGLGSSSAERSSDSVWTSVVEHPGRLLAATFAGLCVFGSLLLSLPSASHQHTALIDAAFTAVSAVCVTGLSVVDTGTHFTRFGQVCLLFLIQVGGLGIMTFSTLALAWIGRRISMRHEAMMQSLLDPHGRGELFGAAKRIVGLTFAFEATGALVLSIAFALRGEDWPGAIFRGVFTAVSAFCNAGFALQSDSLVGYAREPVVLHCVALLIVLGGLSPASVAMLPRLLSRRGPPLPLSLLLPLSTTFVLLLLGTVGMLAFEWTGTLGPFGFLDRLHNAWFQSVTLRTAGFNSVDFAAMRPATVTFSMVMMFIGGSPGSTAGGVKTTTVALLFLAVQRVARGASRVVVFKREVGERSVRRAMVNVSIATAGALVGILALQVTQSLPPIALAFEVISALGTVGLSLGITSALDDVGKTIIMLCMFAGRVGGLSLLMFLSTREGMSELPRRVEEVDVG